MKSLVACTLALAIGLAIGLAPSGVRAATATASPAAVRRFALVVGSNDGGPKRDRLRYAASDAASFARVLDELGGVSASDRVVVLEPTRADVDRAFTKLTQALTAAKGSATRLEVVLYYSGHSDEEGLLLGGARLGYVELQRALGALPADVKIAVLDSCASAALFSIRAKGGTRRPPFLVDESAKIHGHAFLSSSSIDEAALESDEIGGSFFTHYLLTGLRGAADASGDGRVTLNEAYQFAFHETLARTQNIGAGAQHAAYDIQLAGTGDVVMTDLRTLSSGIAFGERVSGRIFVRDGAGQLVAELRKVAGRAVALHLAAGDYRVRVEPEAAAGDRLKPIPREAKVSLVEGRTVELAPEAFQLVDAHPTQVAARGGRAAEEAELEEIGREAKATIEGTRTSSAGRASAGRGQKAGHAGALGPGLAEQASGAEGGAQPSRDPRPSDRAEPRRATEAGSPEGRGGTEVLASASLVPSISSNVFFYGPISTRFSFHVLYSEYARLDGIELGFGLGWATKEARGLRLSLGGNVVEGPFLGAGLALGADVALGQVGGAQVALGAAYGGGTVQGVQTALGLTYGGASVQGIQAALGLALAKENLTGAQLGLGMAYAGGQVRGLQAAGGAALAGGPFEGIQLALGLAWAPEVRGLQAAGVAVSGPVKGVQLGFVNVAGVVDGLQLGLVNVAEDADVAIGLFSFVKKGLLHLDFWGAESGTLANVGVRFGSRYVYTLLSGGWDPRGSHLWTVGFGLGVHVPLRWIFALDMDISASPVIHGARFDMADKAFFTRGRLVLTAELFEHLGVFVGPTMNVLVDFDNDPEALPLVPDHAVQRREVYYWPGLVLGIQL